MAFDPAPTTLLPNWSEDTTNITLPLASLPELTAAEADAVTGDIRKVLWALCTEVYDNFAALAAADKPAKMSITKTQALTTAGNIEHAFTFRFTLATTGLEVAAE